MVTVIPVGGRISVDPPKESNYELFLITVVGHNIIIGFKLEDGRVVQISLEIETLINTIVRLLMLDL